MSARATRSKKTKSVKKDESSSQTSSDGNSNNNYAADIVVNKQRKRSGVTPVKKQSVKSKVMKVTKNVKNVEHDRALEEELDYEDEDLDCIEFIEGNEVIDMTMSHDPMSEDNVSSSSDEGESDLEEGEVLHGDSNSDREESPPRKVIKRKKQNSLQAKFDDVSSTLKVMQEMMFKKGFFAEEKSNDDKEGPQKPDRNKQNNVSKGERIQNTTENNSMSQTQFNSEMTIYREAVLPEQPNVFDDIPTDCTDKELVQVIDKEISFHIKKKDSTSSDDQIDTSDELLDVDKFIADCQEDARRSRESHSSRRDDETAHTTIQSQANQVVKEAEASRARMIAMPGKEQMVVDYNIMQYRQQATIVDESYLVIGNQIDESLCRKIINHEYIDFVKLLNRDRLASHENTHMVLVSRGGSTYFVPVSDTTGTISNFGRWEQAFRAFSNVYIQAYPARVTELIQYNHLIYTASLSLIWENVYRYDKEFRMHLSNFPHRNWGVILQQAWSIYLKDRIQRNDDKGGGSAEPNYAKKKEICKRFNKRKCTSGYKCNYDHRCLICGKFGHGVHICRNKKATDQNVITSPTQMPSVAATTNNNNNNNKVK